MTNRKENIAEIRKMVNVANGMDFRFRCGTISFANPVSIYFAKHGFAKIEKIGIFESLIRTYPIEKTVEYIGKYFYCLRSYNPTWQLFGHVHAKEGYIDEDEKQRLTITIIFRYHLMKLRKKIENRINVDRKEQRD